jgi:hypothetical protein
MAHLVDAVAVALEQERGADLLHQVGRVVGRRAVDAETDRHAGRLHVADRQPPEASTWLLHGRWVTAVRARPSRAIRPR